MSTKTIACVAIVILAFLAADRHAQGACRPGTQEIADCFPGGRAPPTRSAPTSTYRGGGGGGSIDYGAAVGIIGGVLGILGGATSRESGGSCEPGYGLCGDNTCAPLGSVCCGGGRNCPANNICTKDNRCLPVTSSRVCGNGRYCDSGYVCTNDNRCLSVMSERLCSDGHSYCNAGFMCMRDGRCLSMADERYCGNGRYCEAGSLCTGDGGCETYEAREARRQLEERQAAENRELQRQKAAEEEQERQRVAEAERERQQLIEQKRREARQHAEAEEAERVRQSTQKFEMGGQNPFARSPASFPGADAKYTGAPCGESDITGTKGASAVDAKPINSNPCVHIPGWTPQQPYNHSPKSIKIYRANGDVLTVRGATDEDKWGVWMEGAKLMEKLWDGSATDVNTSGPAVNGCAGILLIKGWPSPGCQEGREIDEQQALARAARAASRTPAECTRDGGEIIDPNKDAITEADCTKQGGVALIAIRAVEDYGWLPNTKGCHRKDHENLQKIYNSTAPRKICRQDSHHDGHFQVFTIHEPDPETELFPQDNPFRNALQHESHPKP